MGRLLWALVGVVLIVQSAQPPRVRLHHVHYRVGDPGAAMNATAKALAGTRTVVQGLGVGVRVGNEFVLYERFDESDPAELSQPPIEQAYRAAVGWLESKGILAAPATLSQSGVGPSTAERYHHVAFVASDYEGVTARLGAPLRRTSESALFEAGGGQLVEIVRESDLPDAFWCPMHPDVRSGAPGTCPLCRMELVPIPPPRIGEYRLDVTLQRAGRTVKGVRLAVRDPDSNALVTKFATVHEKLLHLFIVSRDLEYFAHLHPTQLKDGAFALEHPLPPGEYMVIADFLPVDATSQMVQRAIIVPGRAAPRSPGLRDSGTNGLRVSLKTENLNAGKEARLTFTVRDATGKAVTDLEPYLGAPAHMLIVSDDLSVAVHEHPEEATPGGPTITFHPLIPATGGYTLWVQFQRAGRVSTFSFRFRAAS